MMIDYTGQQIGNYRLVRRLGIGGFASVYQAQHLRIATQQAAIKILHLSDVDIQRFQLEAETTAALVHPNIIRLFDFDVSNGTSFLVMDYAPGGSLRSRHSQGTQLPLPTVVEYVKVLAGALQYAHDKNIIHRDIKPENILIGTHQELRLSDFGIAVLSQTGRTTLNPAYGTGGTPFYMAPEQSKGRPEKASDQYALAVMAYEWLCGNPPFSEGNAINIQYQHTYEPVPPLRGKLPKLSEGIEQVILTALSKDPQQRYTSVLAFAQAFEHAALLPQMEERPVRSQQPRVQRITQTESVPRKRQRNSLPLSEQNQLSARKLTSRTLTALGAATAIAIFIGGTALGVIHTTLRASQLFVWIIIAAIVGILGELIAGRHTPAGFLGGTIVGLFAISLLDGFFHFSIAGEPRLGGVPLISSILAAILLVFIWNLLTHRNP